MEEDYKKIMIELDTYWNALATMETYEEEIALSSFYAIAEKLLHIRINYAPGFIKQYERRLIYEIYFIPLSDCSKEVKEAYKECIATLSEVMSQKDMDVVMSYDGSGDAIKRFKEYREKVPKWLV